MMLHPALPPLVGETPTSVVSRNALLHRAPTVRTFCADVGLSFQDIVDGKPTALAQVAILLRVEFDDLAEGAIVRARDAYTFKGQHLVRQTLRRSRVTICPRCLVEDMEKTAQAWSMGGRTLWQLTPIRICNRHGILLSEAAHAKSPHQLHDFARNIAGILPKVARMADEAQPTTPTRLETYLLDRLAGEAGSIWLDALPWHAAARVCEMIGAVATDGAGAPIKRYGDMEWRRAGEAGYVLAAGGSEGIRSFLDGMRSAHAVGRSANEGPQAWWGRLHTWLTDSAGETAYEPLRQAILQYVADEVPVGPGDELYGRPVVSHRRLHSIRTASLETGLHPKRLRKILLRDGILLADHGRLSDDRVIFAADRAAELLTKTRRAINHSEAEAYLGVGRVQLELLVEHGFVRPCAASKKDGLRNRTYDPIELDAFLDALSLKAIDVREKVFPLLGIPEAARRANCGAAEVVSLILSRKLDWVGRWIGGRGYASILVDCFEIRTRTRRDHGSDLNLRTVEEELNTSTRVVTGLIRIAALPSRRAVNRLNRCPYTVVRREDLDAFSASYVSLHMLARERGVHHLVLKKQLVAEGVEPAFDPTIVWASFYRRDALIA